MQDLVVILRIIPEQGPRILMATFGGLIGYGGINSAGMGHMMNALANSTWRMGLPHYPVKRALLEQTSLAGCQEVYARAGSAPRRTRSWWTGIRWPTSSSCRTDPSSSHRAPGTAT